MNRTLRSALRAGSAVAVALAAAGFSCHDQHDCEVRDYGGWSYYGFDADVNSPDRCPFPLTSRGQTKLFSANLFNPYGYAGPDAAVYIYDGAGVRIAAIGAPWLYDAYGRQAAFIDGNYPAGRVAGPDIAQVLSVYATGYEQGIAEGRVTLSYTLPEQLSATMSGPSWASPGTTTWWSVTPKGGVSPYRYQWIKNGQAISGATGSSWSTSFATVGEHNVAVRVTDDLGTVVNYGRKVTVQVTATLDGPTYVGNGQTESVWQASLGSGYQPIQYEWYWGEEPIGNSGSELRLTWWDYPTDGEYLLRVVATDAQGNSSSAELLVYFCVSQYTCAGQGR